MTMAASLFCVRALHSHTIQMGSRVNVRLYPPHRHQATSLEFARNRNTRLPRLCLAAILCSQRVPCSRQAIMSRHDDLSFPSTASTALHFDVDRANRIVLSTPLSDKLLIKLERMANLLRRSEHKYGVPVVRVELLTMEDLKRRCFLGGGASAGSLCLAAWSPVWPWAPFLPP